MLWSGPDDPNKLLFCTEEDKEGTAFKKKKKVREGGKEEGGKDRDLISKNPPRGN